MFTALINVSFRVIALNQPVQIQIVGLKLVRIIRVLEDFGEEVDLKLCTFCSRQCHKRNYICINAI